MQLEERIHVVHGLIGTNMVSRLKMGVDGKLTTLNRLSKVEEMKYLICNPYNGKTIGRKVMITHHLIIAKCSQRNKNVTKRQPVYLIKPGDGWQRKLERGLRASVKGKTKPENYENISIC